MMQAGSDGAKEDAHEEGLVSFTAFLSTLVVRRGRSQTRSVGLPCPMV